jgi:hypothetical protein
MGAAPLFSALSSQRLLGIIPSGLTPAAGGSRWSHGCWKRPAKSGRGASAPLEALSPSPSVSVSISLSLSLSLSLFISHLSVCSLARSLRLSHRQTHRSDTYTHGSGPAGLFRAPHDLEADGAPGSQGVPEAEGGGGQPGPLPCPPWPRGGQHLGVPEAEGGGGQADTHTHTLQG